MILAIKTYTLYILVLEKFLDRMFGPHYPREIVKLIIFSSVNPQINCGGNFTSFVDGIDAYAWGWNDTGNLGLCHTNWVLKPTKIHIPGIKSISHGLAHSIALSALNSSELYVWGNNIHGQLGLGHDHDQLIPQKRVFSEPVESVVCGAYFNVCMTKSNKIYVWGSNVFGQLGLGYLHTAKYVPQLLDLANCVQIKCGKDHVIALTKKKIYVWGMNDHGQLGLGHTENRCRPHELFIPKTIVSVGCGASHTIALTECGEIYTWGYNSYGQLGIGSIIDQYVPQKVCLKNVISVCCGGYHTVAIVKSLVPRTMNKIYVWGSNFYQQFGLTTSRYREQSVPQEFVLNFEHEPNSQIEVACGDFHTVFMVRYGIAGLICKLYTCGANEYGQLGSGFTSRCQSLTEIKI